MTALVEPDLVKVDLLDVLQARGFLFNASISPDGMINEDLKTGDFHFWSLSKKFWPTKTDTHMRVCEVTSALMDTKRNKSNRR